MSEIRDIMLDLVIPPDRPMRETTINDGIDELARSMMSYGLQQPIGVVETNEGYYRLIWGMRRTLAAKELAWKNIRAVVFQEGEADEDMLMGHENLQRSQVSPCEEARWYAHLMEKYRWPVAEVARQARRSPGHVAKLLSLLGGDQAVFDSLDRGEINAAQAVEINKVRDEPGRKLALGYAKHNGLTAMFIRSWREQREAAGADVELEKAVAVATEERARQLRSQQKCDLHGDWVDVQGLAIWAVCDDCRHMIAAALEAQSAVQQEVDKGGTLD